MEVEEIPVLGERAQKETTMPRDGQSLKTLVMFQLRCEMTLNVNSTLSFFS